MRGLGWYLLLQLGSVRSFYVPGVAPIDFQIEEKLDIKAVKMTSSKTQLPYEYYSLPMCKPETVRGRVKFFHFFRILRPTYWHSPESQKFKDENFMNNPTKKCFELILNFVLTRLYRPKSK